MALNALVDSFLPQSEKNVGLKGLTSHPVFRSAALSWCVVRAAGDIHVGRNVRQSVRVGGTNQRCRRNTFGASALDKRAPAKAL